MKMDKKYIINSYALSAGVSMFGELAMMNLKMAEEFNLSISHRLTLQCTGICL